VNPPNSYLIRMAVFLAAVLAVAAVLSPVLLQAYGNNPGLNSLILVVLLIGIAWNLRQVLRLSPEVAWMEGYQDDPARLKSAPSKLAPERSTSVPFSLIFCSGSGTRLTVTRIFTACSLGSRLRG